MDFEVEVFELEVGNSSNFECLKQGISDRKAHELAAGSVVV